MMEAASYDLPATFRDKCKLLEMYFDARVYKDCSRILTNINREGNFGTLFESIQALENPAHQAVEFHVMHLFPGPLETAMALRVEEDANDATREAARQVLINSNMGRRKRYFTERLALHGEVFLQATSRADGKPYLKVVEAPLVTDYEEDILGYLTLVRLDVWTGETENPWLTQLWSKEGRSLREWRNKQGPAARIEDLGTPEETMFSEWGIDFVPFVRAVFIESGGARGVGVFEKHLDPMDELNRQATDVRRLFKDNAEGVWWTSPNEAGRGATSYQNRPRPESGEGPKEYEAHGRRIIDFPGHTTLSDAVASINYADGLAQIRDTRDVLELILPELRYFKGRQGGDPSAAALREDCRGAISRARDAKGNAEAAFIQGLQMCLSIGAQSGRFPVAGEGGIGTFGSGDFDLAFVEREVMPETPMERASRELAEANAMAAWGDVSEAAMVEAFERAGYSPEDAARLAKSPEESRRQSTLERLMNGGANLAGDE